MLIWRQHAIVEHISEATLSLIYPIEVWHPLYVKKRRVRSRYSNILLKYE